MADVGEGLGLRRQRRGRATGRGNGSGDNGAALGVRLARLEERVDDMRESMRESMATKADLLKVESNLIRWMVGMYAVSGIALVVAVVRTLI